VPSVAFDPNIHAHLPRLARPAQQPDRAPSPFESLLDDNTQAADQSAPPPPENKAAPADSTQSPAQTSDGKSAAAAKDDTSTTKADDADPINKPGDDAKPVAGEKGDVNVKTAAASEGIKQADNDDKPLDGPKADNPTIAPPTNNIQTIIATDAAAVAPAPTPNQGPTPNPNNPALDLSAIVADGTPNLKGFDPTAPKAGTGKQTDGEKKADVETQVDANASTGETTNDLQTTASVTPQPHVDKPQFAASDDDKDRVAQARGEIPTNGHRGSAGTPASVSGDVNVAAPTVAADTATPSTAVTGPTDTTPTAATPMALITQPGPQPGLVPLAGIAIEIAGKAMAGKNRFEIRLDPPELGRIEVRLDVDRDGNVTSRLTVDRADTLDLLRRDASGLERALQDAGLKTADNGLQFSLRDQSMNQQQTGGRSDTAQLVVKDETLPSIDVIPQNYGRLAGQGGGLDIRV
jgi:flagellar hook-length control protein FliK